jgi:hypothetical protein
VNDVTRSEGGDDSLYGKSQSAQNGVEMAANNREWRKAA